MSNLHVELQAPNGTKYLQPTGLFINNEWVKSSPGAGKEGSTIVSINPTNESEITKVECASAEDVNIAVSAARTAFKSWRNVVGTERGKLLYKLSQLAEAHKDILATIDTWDNGKPYGDAVADIEEAIEVFRYYGGYSDKIFGQVIDTTPEKFAYTIREPIGVCGQIIPWNFPMLMAAWKIGPALACGNTIVMKPAEQTPLSILYFANLIKEAGFPAGVVNILNGYGKEAGAALASHPGVDKIAFTGSTITAREIMKMAAINLKNITLETGGKSPLLIFDDCDMEQAIKWSHFGIMLNQGQVCTATSRLLVQDTIYDKFIVAFKEQVKKVSVIGDPFEEGTFQGPQVTKTQYERVLSYVQSGKDQGATLYYGGEPFSNPSTNGKGYFITPTVFTDVKANMDIWRQEVFGPFVTIMSFKTEEEAVEKANDSDYGLGSAVFTKDLERAHRVARNLEAGMVWVNSSQDSDFRVPFGGVKQSGIGRELGEAGLDAYSNKKAVHINMGNRL